MLDTWPHTHLAGSLGQVGSTSNLGIMRGAGAASEESMPVWRRAMVAMAASSRTRMIFMVSLPLPGLMRVRVSIAPMEAAGNPSPLPSAFAAAQLWWTPSPARGEGKWCGRDAPPAFAKASAGKQGRGVWYGLRRHLGGALNMRK